MVGQMRALTHLGTSASAIILVTSSAITFAVGTAGANPGADDVTTVALDATLRNCDFSLTRTPPTVPSPALGTGSVQIHRAGSRVVAEVHLVAPNEPGMHYNVGLIEEPRPSSATCGPGDPGTAFAGLDTDAAGGGTTTVQDSVRPGTTGVWAIIERPNPNSQNPAEFYTSEFVASV
jgi:hypothetical protein